MCSLGSLLGGMGYLVVAQFAAGVELCCIELKSDRTASITDNYSSDALAATDTAGMVVRLAYVLMLICLRCVNYY